MDKQAAAKIIRDTFEKPFDKGRFINFIKNLVNYLDASKNFTYQGNIIPDAYDRSIQSLERIGKYEEEFESVHTKIDEISNAPPESMVYSSSLGQPNYTIGRC